MVEIIDQNLLVHNPTYAESIKEYSYNDALVYCENLESGGYLDFRVPTQQELFMILTIAKTSEIEMAYFPNYFNHYSGGFISSISY